MAGREERTLRDPPLKRVTGETGIRLGCKAVWPGVSRGFRKGGQVKNYRICEHKRERKLSGSIRVRFELQEYIFHRNICLKGVSGLRRPNVKVLIKSTDQKGLSCSQENFGRCVVLGASPLLSFGVGEGAGNARNLFF